MKTKYYISLLLILCCFNVFSQTTGGSFNINVAKNDTSYISFSGRQYLNLNTWRGFSKTYGHDYHQFNQSLGTGSVSSINWANQGFYIGRTQKLISLDVNGRYNNAESMNIEWEVSCFNTTGTTVNVRWRKTISYSTNDSSFKEFSIPIDELVYKGDEIQVAARKTSGTTTTRYFYLSGNLIFTQ